MKKLLFIGALATVIASPPFAQSYDTDLGTANINVPSVYSQIAATGHFAAADAFASVDTKTPKAGRPDGGTVEPWGAIARDPDPSIRSELNREAQESY